MYGTSRHLKNFLRTKNQIDMDYLKKPQTLKEIDERIDFIWNRMDALEKCEHHLETTANSYYDPQGKALKGWNTLLKGRDNIKPLKEDCFREIEALKKKKEKLEKDEKI